MRIELQVVADPIQFSAATEFEPLHGHAPKLQNHEDEQERVRWPRARSLPFEVISDPQGP